MSETCAGKHCPLLDRKCIEHDCAMYQRLLGAHPQTGAPVDHYDCAHRWHNILLIEHVQQTRQTGASVDQLRADNVNVTAAFIKSILAAARTPRPMFRLPWRKA